MYSILLNILFLIVLFFSFGEQFLYGNIQFPPVAFALPIVLLYILILMTMIVISSFSIPLYSGKKHH